MRLPKEVPGLYKTAKGTGNMALLPKTVPKPAPNEVLLEIKATGICGTDIHIMHDKFPYWPPVIMGHEFSGLIVEVGSRVTDYQVGDRVVGEPHTQACGKCALCRTGNIQICSQKRSPGWGIDGSFTKYLPMPEHLLHRIPDEMSFEEAALVEPAANVVQDVLERGKIVANDTVVIFGPGPIGLLSIMAAKAGGAGKIIVVGVEADENLRLPVARELGVDAILLADRQNIVEEIMRISNGRGADLVVEASGAPAAIRASVEVVRRMGRITQIGLSGQETIPFPWDKASWKVCEVIFNLSTAFTCWDRTIGLIASKKMDVAKLITHTFPLEGWQEAFHLVESQQALKVLFKP